MLRLFRLRAQLWYHNQHVRSYVCLDRLASLDAKAEQCERSLVSASDLREVHSYIRSLKNKCKKGTSKVMRVIGPNGLLASSLAEEKGFLKVIFVRSLAVAMPNFKSFCSPLWIAYLIVPHSPCALHWAAVPQPQCLASLSSLNYLSFLVSAPVVKIVSVASCVAGSLLFLRVFTFPLF